MVDDFAPLGRFIRYEQNAPNFADFECGTDDSCLVEENPGVSQPAKVESSAGTQVRADLRGKLLLPFHPEAVGDRLQRFDMPLTQFGLRKSGQPASKLVVLEYALATVREDGNHGSSDVTTQGWSPGKEL